MKNDWNSLVIGEDPKREPVFAREHYFHNCANNYIKSMDPKVESFYIVLQRNNLVFNHNV